MVEESWIAMRDGVRLATDVYLPSRPGRCPAIVVRLPYGKRSRDDLIPFMGATATERGYAFVVQDTRGKFASEGSARPFAPEVLDGYDTVEWVTRQAWCRGDVALSGGSYYGFTQWATIASAHPAVRAFAPQFTTSDVGEWIWRQGVFQLGLMATWAAFTWSNRSPGEWDKDLDWSTRPLGDLMLRTVGERNPTFEHLADPRQDWHLESYGGRNPVRALAVPGLHRGGWWDPFNRGQVSDWALATATSTQPQRLVMDATDHWSATWSDEPQPVPDFAALPDAQLAAEGEARLRPALDFFDDAMAGRQVAGPRVTWKLTHRDWREGDHWPPAGSRPRVLHLAGEAQGGSRSGALTWSQPRSDSWQAWTHDPQDLVPTDVMPDGTGDLLMPPNDALVEDRADVLVFTSDPVTQPLDLAGPVLAQLQVRSSAPTMHVVVRLLDVLPDGRTRRIRDGVARADLAQSEAHVVVDLGHTGYRVRQGHRLRVHVASSDFPRVMPYFGDDRDPWTATGGVPNEQGLRVGGAHGARVVVTAL